MDDTATTVVGQRFLGDYQITDKLGEGAMGAVYLAHQPAIDQKIAVKVLRPRAAKSDEIVGRFHREARVISMLSHPNIVRVLVFGRLQRHLAMAMEFVDGRQLQACIDDGLMAEIRVIKIVKQVLSALAEAHDLGIVHRDLKPDNILLTEFRGERDFVKILDFGIAKLLQPDDDQAPLTQAGIVYGTPFYLSPEQARADSLDARTDIYSLGCILYELMCGQKPFEGQDLAKIVRQQANEQPRPARQVAGERVSATMAAIIDKAMAKDPDDRFDNAMAMFEALGGRENQLLAAGDIDRHATGFPGSEVTGPRPVVAAVEASVGPGHGPADDPGNESITIDKKFAAAIVATSIFLYILMLAMIVWLVANG